MSSIEFMRLSSGVILDPKASALSPRTAAQYFAKDTNSFELDEAEQGYLDAFVLAGRIIYRLILLSAAALYLFNQFFGHINLVD